jgi:hypothetical protein
MVLKQQRRSILSSLVKVAEGDLEEGAAILFSRDLVCYQSNGRHDTKWSNNTRSTQNSIVGRVTDNNTARARPLGYSAWVYLVKMSRQALKLVLS